MRNTARKHIETKSSLQKTFSRAKSVNEKVKSTDDYKEQLRHYYLGNSEQVLKYEKSLEEDSPHYFYEWSYCYVFKNPDAQKKENLIKREEAFNHIDSFFKPLEMENDVQKSKMKHAHEEVVSEILDKMMDENGKVKKFKGGR